MEIDLVMKKCCFETHWLSLHSNVSRSRRLQRLAMRESSENRFRIAKDHSPFWIFFASSPLSSSLSICGNEPPRQNKGRVDATVADVAALVSFVELSDVETSLDSFELAVSSRILSSALSSSMASLSLVVPLHVMRFIAYFLLMELFFVISSRRFKLHSARLLVAFLSSKQSVYSMTLWSLQPDTVGHAGNVNSSNGIRQIACSTPTSNVCSRCGRSSPASISIDNGVRGSAEESQVINGDIRGFKALLLTEMASRSDIWRR